MEAEGCLFLRKLGRCCLVQVHIAHAYVPFPLLLLFPLLQVYHQMVMLEKLHQVPEFSPATSVDAITKRPLRLH